MDIFTAYSAINKSVLEVLYSLNKLKPVEEYLKPDFIRLEETPFILTEETAVNTQVVTAHDLQQYKNSFHSIRLQADVHTWLQELLKIDEMELEDFNI